jgi:Family of unknown function (DUF5990)
MRRPGRVLVASGTVQIRIEGSDLPGSSCDPSLDVPGGYHGVHVGVQRRNKRDELLGLVAGDAASATWTLDYTVTRTPGATDVKGPYIQGPPRARFIYLSWVTVDDDATCTLFRRAKLWLDGVPPAVIDRAAVLGVLVGRLSLTDRKGHPTCSAGRPPSIEWSAEPAE